MDTQAEYGNMANRGKYKKLYHWLNTLEVREQRATFGDIERVIGFGLPKSARLHRPWWANQKAGGHSHALAWLMAGWKTTEVDMEAEQLLFQREQPQRAETIRLDEAWPVRTVGAWPASLSLSREDIYEDRA